MKYAIYPSIGIARVGNSPGEFFIAAETPDSPGTELRADGSEQPVTRRKDAGFRMKRQAARFRIFEFDDAGGAVRPVQLPAGASVRWSVTLANKKDAVVRPSDPVAEDPSAPVQFPLPTLDAARQNRHIRASGVAPAAGQPTVSLSGRYLTESVLLGELLTDRGGNLLVLGGHGISRSPEGADIGSEPNGGGYYDNRGWYDDVSDGPISAEIVLPGGAPPIRVTSGWVIVAPPDFAPATGGVVTLFDVMKQAALDAGISTLPSAPSFSNDIWPMLRRAADLRWVNNFADPNAHWKQFSTNWSALADRSPGSRPLREAHAALLRQIGASGELQNFSLRPWQESYVTAWAAGNFTSDFTGTIPGTGVLLPEVLTRTALDAGVGQGFFPGIEAGIIITNETLCAEPYRLAPVVQPGDLTALMALPWQADFLKCNANWWPSQRPDDAPQAGGTTALPWIRPIRGPRAHRDLVANFGRLGVIEPQVVGGQKVFVEVDRDPTF